MSPVIRLNFAMLLWLFPCLALAGGSTGGGNGEYIRTESNPWYIGEEPVCYRVERSDNSFSVPLSQLRAQTKKSIEAWVETIRALHPLETRFPLPDGHRKTVSLDYRDATDLPVAELRKLCPRGIELNILYGLVNNTIREELSHTAVFTTGIARFSSIDELSGRASGGYVWIAPDMGKRALVLPDGSQNNPGYWSEGTRLANALAHEFGHIFGFGHHHGTVMEAQVPARSAAHWYSWDLERHELRPSSSFVPTETPPKLPDSLSRPCNVILSHGESPSRYAGDANLGQIDLTDPAHQISPEAAEFFGIPTSGRVIACRDSDPERKVLILGFNDDAGSKSVQFKISLTGRASRQGSVQGMYKNPYSADGDYISSVFFRFDPSNEFWGSIEVRGKRYPVLVRLNEDIGEGEINTLRITVLDGPKAIDLEF